MRRDIALCWLLLFTATSIAAGQDAPSAESPANPAAGAPPAADAPAAEANETARRRELERQLSKTLTGATLVGRFNVATGQGQNGDFREDRYDLVSVRKLLGEWWLFRVRIRYGGNDLTVPLTIPVKWAGDTPVITVNQLSVPGLGTYDARVMIHRDYYAGTWFAADHGGLMFGRIERTNPEAADRPTADGDSDRTEPLPPERATPDRAPPEDPPPALPTAG